METFKPKFFIFYFIFYFFIVFSCERPLLALLLLESIRILQ
jgi:hypothetical protein